MKVRRTNDSCLTCGGQLPTKVNKVEKPSGELQYRCPDCGWKIAQGVVVRERGDAQVQTPNHMSGAEPTVAINVDIHQWEKWWTDRAIVSAIHGRVVAGEEKLYQLICELENIYERS